MVLVMDDWMRAAMADDRVVVELLVRLKKAHAVAPVKVPMLPPTKWGVRQPRSRFPIRFDARTLQKDATDSTRNSPTTPLSWTASAASPSCTADGLDESSVRCVVTARSKGVGNLSNDFTNNSGTKRSRRKKTYAELIEEETFLLKQKMYLKKEIEKMQATYKEQRERNQILKKMKVDLNTNNDMNESKLSSSSSDSQTVSDPYQESHHDDPSRNKNNVFLLPDLNMEPFEEDSAGFQVF